MGESVLNWPVSELACFELACFQNWPVLNWPVLELACFELARPVNWPVFSRPKCQASLSASGQFNRLRLGNWPADE